MISYQLIVSSKLARCFETQQLWQLEKMTVKNFRNKAMLDCSSNYGKCLVVDSKTLKQCNLSLK
jgi:hypothetical protein